MHFIRVALSVSACIVAQFCFAQTVGKPSEKIVFVRPDPMITTSSSMAMKSADTRGGGVRMVISPEEPWP